MAEERLIDDDINKGKKYKIRKNENGEDELYIENPDEEEESISFEVPEFETDDEDAAVMTPEQLAAREKAKAEEEQRRKEAIASLLQKARASIESENFEEALNSLALAAQADETCGEAYMLEVIALTRNLTEFNRERIDDALSENVAKYCTEEQKATLAAMSEPLYAEYCAVAERTAELRVENERKKAERRDVFAERSKRATLVFSIALVPLVAFVALAISMGLFIFTEQTGKFLILTIVFAALAAVNFVVELIFSRKMWEARRNCSLNEKNSSTALGREFEENEGRMLAIKALLASFREV